MIVPFLNSSGVVRWKTFNPFLGRNVRFQILPALCRRVLNLAVVTIQMNGQRIERFGFESLLGTMLLQKTQLSYITSFYLGVLMETRHLENDWRKGRGYAYNGAVETGISFNAVYFALSADFIVKISETNWVWPR